MALLFIFVLFIIGFACFYQTSKKIPVNKSVLGKWLNSHPTITKFIGTALLIGATCLYIEALGFAVGLFYSIIILLAVSSWFVLLIPLRLLNSKNK